MAVHSPSGGLARLRHPVSLHTLQTGRHRGWLLIAVVLAVLGIAGSVIGAIAMGRSDGSSSTDAFRLRSSQIVASARSAILRDEDVVVEAGGFAVDSPHASNRAFVTWAGDARLLSRYPELSDLVRIVFVARSALPAYAVAAARHRTGPLGPHGTFAVIPSGSRPYYCFGSLAVYRDPMITPMGTDDCADGRGALLLDARDSGQLILYPFRSGAATYLGIITAVYRGGVVPRTVAARRAAFSGWVGSLVSANVVLRAALLGHPHTAVSLSQSITGSRVAPVELTLGTTAPHASTVTVNLHNGSSITTFATVAGSGVFTHGNSRELLLGGSLVSVLIGLLVLGLGTGRARALRLVGEQIGQLSYQAMHDGLTDLPNRALLTDRAEQMLARARRTDSRVAALFIDVDGFKQVNDTYGHAAGDELLKAVASRLSGVLRGSDTVGRQGGDEFVALLEGDREAKPEVVAERMLELLRQPIVLAAAKGAAVRTTSSIGIALGQRSTADELLRDADLALYEAKAAGKDRYVLFEESMQTEAAGRRALEIDLAGALANDQLFVLYQPTFDLQSQLVTGVEALVRWRHPTRGIVMPDTFIPMAEDTAMIVPIGRWVLNVACRQAQAWAREGHAIGMSVNLSARQLDNDGLVTDVGAALRDSGLDPGRLTLEITETVLMRDARQAATRLAALKDLGVRLAIDDFGTGYSSLAYLRQFPVDALKIDRSFIAGISSSTEAAALMHTLVQLGKTLGLETLGEGIEEQAQLEQLQREQCDSGQGFLYARPMDFEAIGRFLQDQPSAVGTLGSV
jgi:diguanylate cyclase (GGDEF)-like protein